MTNTDLPCVFRGAKEVEEWTKYQVVSVTLGTFGAQYKKSPSYKSEGRSQAPLCAKEGKEQTQNLFSKFSESIRDSNERFLEQSLNLNMQLIDSFNKLIILLPRNCEYGAISNKH